MWGGLLGKKPINCCYPPPPPPPLLPPPPPPFFVTLINMIYIISICLCVPVEYKTFFFFLEAGVPHAKKDNPPQKEPWSCSFLQTNVGGSRISLEYSLSYCSESVWSDLIVAFVSSSLVHFTPHISPRLDLRMCRFLLISSSNLKPLWVNESEEVVLYWRRRVLRT